MLRKARQEDRHAVDDSPRLLAAIAPRVDLLHLFLGEQIPSPHCCDADKKGATGQALVVGV